MNTKKQQAGQMGGIATKMKYGIEHYSEMGRRGGRPRRQPPTLSGDNGKRRLATDGDGNLPNNLKDLRELWKQNKGAGIAGG